MNISVVMIDDKHSDTEPVLFTTPEEAVAYARKTAQEFAREPGDVMEQVPPPRGWLYYARYSPESRIWVIEKPLNGRTDG